MTHHAPLPRLYCMYRSFLFMYCLFTKPLWFSRVFFVSMECRQYHALVLLSSVLVAAGVNYPVYTCRGFGVRGALAIYNRLPACVCVFARARGLTGIIRRLEPPRVPLYYVYV